MDLEFKTLDIRKIGKEEVNSVNLRELYLDLGYSEANFTTWCKKNLLKDFIENQDYVQLFLEKKLNETETKRGGNNKAIDYIVTLDTAKHLALMSKTEKGKEIRQYFINVEKVARKTLGDRKLELEMKKLEAEELSIAEQTNLLKEEIIDKRVKRVKLLQELGCNFDPISIIDPDKVKSVLNKETSELISDAYSDIRTGIKVYSATSLLNDNQIPIKTKDFNDAMIQAGKMEKYFYKNRPYKRFVDTVNYYGYNRDASSVTINPQQVCYYEDRFMELVLMLQNEGYLD